MEKADLITINGLVLKIAFSGSRAPVVKLPFQQGALLKLNISRNLTINDTSWVNLTGNPLDNEDLRLLLESLQSEIIEYLKEYFESIFGGIIPGDLSSGILDGYIIWTSGLNFISSLYNYKILGQKLKAGPRELALEQADPNFARIDLFYLTIFGSLEIKKGIATENPASPELTIYELLARLVLIPAGSSVPGNIQIIKIFDEHAGPPTEFTAAETHDENVTVDFDSEDEPAVGTICFKVDIAIPDTVIEIPMHFLGQRYQGGRIFYIAPDGKSGLIAAETDQETSIIWETLNGVAPYATGASGMALSAGRANTNLILANPNCVNFAVRKCVNDAFSIDGFKGWHLPSIVALAEMRARRNEIGSAGFAGKTYWSSTEATGTHNWDRAMCIAFNTGTQFTRDKNDNLFAIRLIRAFDDSEIVANQPVLTFTPLNTKMIFTGEQEYPVQDGVFSMNLRSSVPWQENTMLIIESYLGATKTGQVVMSPLGYMFEYDHNSDAWQTIIIPMTAFGTNNTKLDGFRITLAGSWTNNISLRGDDIRYQTYDGVIHEIPPEKKPDEIPFTNTSTPSILEYDKYYSKKWGQYPIVRLFVINESGNRKERYDIPTLVLTDGIVTSIEYDLGDIISGVMVLGLQR